MARMKGSHADLREHCINAQQVMREGKDVTLIAFGKLVGYNLKAAEILEKEGISAEACAVLKRVDGVRDAVSTQRMSNSMIACAGHQLADTEAN